MEEVINILKKLKIGVEFGGSTGLFQSGDYSLYPFLNRIDGFNIFENNFWKNDFTDDFICLNKRTGRQYNIDVCDEKAILNHPVKYDFILHSHLLEHIANPLRSLLLWKNIMKEKSYIFSIIPHKSYMFDALRELTTLNHLIDDYNKNVDESDETHLEDAINNYDFSKPGDYSNYVNSMKNNFERRCIHHHCFDDKLVDDLYEYCRYEIIIKSNVIGHNIMTFVKKL